mmetsp:Transcript_2910/g.6279  ORF Transcript_2910/g.6279 Transcript_2910/m.6279 type:complete len:105 (-) Transcript_2910:5556-5870(-)
MLITSVCGKRKVTMNLLSGHSLTCLCAIIAVAATNAQEINNESKMCRTRFTFSRPTNENASSILFGVNKKQNQQHKNSSFKILFNHGDFVPYLILSLFCAPPLT